MIMSDKDFSEKLKQVEKVSNVYEVVKKARQLYGNDVKIGLSSRKNNKFMIFNPISNQFIHFGNLNYEDYTKHQDEDRRKRFQIRNHNFASAPKYSARYMAYYILW